MPLSMKEFAQALAQTPIDATDEQKLAQVTGGKIQPNEPGVLSRAWELLNRPLVGSPDALVPAGRHEHGQDESWLRKTGEDLGAGLTTPLNLATEGLGVAGGVAGRMARMGSAAAETEGARALVPWSRVSHAARIAEATTMAPAVIEGTSHALTGDTPGEQLGGVAGAGLAGMGVKSAMNRAFKPEVVRDVFMGENRMTPRPREPLDPKAMMQTADEFAAMKHTPNDPQTKASYDSLKEWLDKQFLFLQDRVGVKMEPHQENYPGGSKAMVADVRKNNHLDYFPTEVAHGNGTPVGAGHPMLDVSPQTGLKYNDMLRAVHDYLGHAVEGNEFGPKGELAAFQAHKDTMPALAHGALDSETNAQNAQVNFGAHLRNEQGVVPTKGQPGYVPQGQRPYADQKAGLLPKYDQTPESILQDGGNFGIISGKMKGMSNEEVQAAHQQLEKELLDRGYKPRSQKGIYDGEPEPSVLVPGPDAPVTQQIGDKFKQDAVITHEGYTRSADKKVFPKTGMILDSKATDYVSEIPRHGQPDLRYELEYPREAFEPAPNAAQQGHSGAVGPESIQPSLDQSSNQSSAGPGLRQAGSTALAVAGPAASASIDDSDPNDPNQAIKHYGKVGLDIAGIVGAGSAVFGMAAKRANALPAAKEAAAHGAALMMMGVKKGEWATRLMEQHGVLPEALPKIRNASEKILATQIVKSQTGLTKTKRLLDYLHTGMGDSEWYNTGDELKQHFGQDAPIVAKLIAATSNNSTVKANLTLALKAYAQHKANPEAPIEGIMRSLLPAIDRARADLPLNGRKVDNFAKALLGDPDAVVVDRWMMRAFGFKGDVPTPTQYDVIEHSIRELAKQQGIEPRQAQASLWFGVKKKLEGTGRPDSPAYGTILNGYFGGGAPVQDSLQTALGMWKGNRKKGFGDNLRKAVQDYSQPSLLSLDK